MFSRTGTPFLHSPLLIAAITSVCSSGFLLFGYDQGIMLGYYIRLIMEYSFGTQISVAVPIAFSVRLAVYILVVTVWLPHTPRWLMRRHENERGVAVLAALRGVDRRVRW